MMQRTGLIQRTAFVLAALALAWAGGCTSVKVTGTARTGTEQLLLTGSWDDVLARVNFQPLAGARVFLDGQYVTNGDKEWVLSSIRRAMAEQGVLLENNKDKAQVILEPAFGAWGTDQRNTTTGLPGLGLGASLTGPTITSGSSSSLNFTQSDRQDAVVKGAMFAYDAKTGRIVWESGTFLNAQGVRDHFVFGHGPYRMSSRGEVEQYPDEAQSQTRKHFLHRFFGNTTAPGH
jgi:hypothetical protein